jgi:hypothetical protein
MSRCTGAGANGFRAGADPHARDLDNTTPEDRMRARDPTNGEGYDKAKAPLPSFAKAVP